MVLTGKKEEVNTIISKMPSNPIANKAFQEPGQPEIFRRGNAMGFYTSFFFKRRGI